MRKANDGSHCEETLGEYYELCLELFGKKACATQYILGRINASSKKEKVKETDAEMRAFLIQLEMDHYGIKGKA